MPTVSVWNPFGGRVKHTVLNRTALARVPPLPDDADYTLEWGGASEQFDAGFRIGYPVQISGGGDAGGDTPATEEQVANDIFNNDESGVASGTKPPRGRVDTMFAEIGRSVENVRVENPDDASQYVIVERIKAIAFRGSDNTNLILNLRN